MQNDLIFLKFFFMQTKLTNYWYPKKVSSKFKFCRLRVLIKNIYITIATRLLYSPSFSRHWELCLKNFSAYRVTTESTLTWYVTQPSLMINCGNWFCVKKTETHPNVKLFPIFNRRSSKTILSEQIPDCSDYLLKLLFFFVENDQAIEKTHFFHFFFCLYPALY